MGGVLYDSLRYIMIRYLFQIYNWLISRWVPPSVRSTLTHFSTTELNPTTQRPLLWSLFCWWLSSNRQREAYSFDLPEMIMFVHCRPSSNGKQFCGNVRTSDKCLKRGRMLLFIQIKILKFMARTKINFQYQLCWLII